MQHIELLQISTTGQNAENDHNVPRAHLNSPKNKDHGKYQVWGRQIVKSVYQGY